MKRVLVAVFSALVMALSLLAFNPAPASAGECSWAGCGEVQVWAGSRDGMTVTGDWGDKNPRAWLNPGTWSGNYFADTDGIYVPSGQNIQCGERTSTYVVVHVTFTATGWHKITDNFDKKCWVVLQ